MIVKHIINLRSAIYNFQTYVGMLLLQRRALLQSFVFFLNFMWCVDRMHDRFLLEMAMPCCESFNKYWSKNTRCLQWQAGQPSETGALVNFRFDRKRVQTLFTYTISIFIFVGLMSSTLFCLISEKVIRDWLAYVKFYFFY